MKIHLQIGNIGTQIMMATPELSSPGLKALMTIEVAREVMEKLGRAIRAAEGELGARDQEAAQIARLHQNKP